jgi:hypothetical protein
MACRDATFNTYVVTNGPLPAMEVRGAREEDTRAWQDFCGIRTVEWTYVPLELSVHI